MPAQLLKEFLDSHNVKYVCLKHSPAFTAQEIAASAHISGKELAKTVIVKMKDRFAMIVLSANEQINFATLRELTGGENIKLASEAEFKDKFPACEVGAMPPFGNLYGMPVYISYDLAKQGFILFNAGSHSELIQMLFTDFERIVKPKILSFA